MKFIFLDFETYYAKDYTLRKMTPAEYILDPRFETICVAVQIDDGPVELIDGPDFREWISQHDPKECTVVTYNALFDMCILAWHYAFVPARMVDALGMARALLGHKLRGLSLEKVAEHFKLPPKGDAILKVIGLRRADILNQWDLWGQFVEYAKHDVVLLRAIFDKLAPSFPPSEFRIMDLVLRAAVEPMFRIDMIMLTQHLADVRAEKAAVIATTGATAVELRGVSSFVALLEAEGVEIDYKEGKSSPIPALAKTDDFMNSLLEDDNPRVQALACARLGVKSTLEESRAERLLRIAALNWQCYRDGNPRFYSGGTMPIPLRYAGAHTMRLSGEWKINMQNMPRGGKLRKSLVPPPGHKVVVADLGQIEARLTAYICHAETLLKAFQSGNDPYAVLASHIFQRPINREVDIIEGFIGKTGVLGLGFGAGPTKFYSMVVRTARSMGMDMDKLRAIWDMKMAMRTVEIYRTVNLPIMRCWWLLDQVLKLQWSGLNGEVRFGPVVIGHGTVRGPGGLTMRYDVIPDSGPEKKFGYGMRTHKIYGSKFLENIIQFVARIILMNAALRINDRGYRFALQAHDELAFIVPENDVERAMKIIHEEMTRPPSWAPDLPLTASVEYGDSYGDAK